MKDIKFTVSDKTLNRLVDAICGLCHYKEKIVNPDTEEDNPETKQQFTRRNIKEDLMKKVQRWENLQAKKNISINEIIIE